MSDQGSKNEDVRQQTKPLKDRKCEFCGHAFTSSSLGRHYDVFIREKNPKPPDGVHDIEKIRIIRGNITRRQSRSGVARGALPGRRASAANSTPSAISSRPSPAELQSNENSSRRDLPGYPFKARWEASGVINSIDSLPVHDVDDQGRLPAAPTPSIARPRQSRNFSRQLLHKSQLEARQKATEMADRARAAELALREILLAWRAARLQTDVDSMPFDFDPRELDFPALTLQCLEPPPTLFSSNIHPNSSSWSIQPPDQLQFEALRIHFTEKFRQWHVTCQFIATAFHDDICFDHTEAEQVLKQNALDHSRVTGEKVDALERSVKEHLQAAYKVWSDLTPERRHELWLIELARAVGRRKKESDKQRQKIRTLNQEVTSLKTQLDHLNNLQQPLEVKIQQPVTMPFDENIVSMVLDQETNRKQAGLGFTLTDSHLDLNMLVNQAIERWKTVVVSTRTTSNEMSSQRHLDQQSPVATPTTLPPVLPQSQAGPSPVSTAPPPSVSAPPAAARSPIASLQQALTRPQGLQQQQNPQQRQHQQPIASQSEGSQVKASLSKGAVLPPYARSGLSSQPSQPLPSNDHSFASSNTSDDAKPSIPIAQMEIDDTSDQDADGDADVEEDEFIDTSQASQQAQSPIEVARAGPLDTTPQVQHQQQQQPQQMQQQQHQHQHQLHQAQQNSQYMLAGGRMHNGTNPAGNHAMNQGVNIARQMMHHGVGAGNRMGLGIPGQEDIYMQ